MTTQLDRIFEHELEIITSLKGVLSKKDRIHFCKWISRLQYICRTKHERVIRNRYLELLSLQVQLLGHLEEPFTHIPPDGNLEPVPIYWLERLQKVRASLNRARSPQVSSHDRSAARSPQFSQVGGRQQPYPYPQEYENHRTLNGEYSRHNDYGYASSALGDHMYTSGFRQNCEIYTHGEHLPNELLSSLSKGASFTSHSLVEDYSTPPDAVARRDTSAFDKFKIIKKGDTNALDASSTRDSFPDIHYLQLNRSPMNEELSSRITHLLKHELPTDLQIQAAQSSTLGERPVKDRSPDEDTTIITELQAVPESVPNTNENSYKLMASALDSISSARQTFSLSKSNSGQQRDTQTLSVESARNRKVLTPSNIEGSTLHMQEQRYVVAATIEAPLSLHTSRSGTARSTRSTRGSESLADAPIMTASQHCPSSHAGASSVNQENYHRAVPLDSFDQNTIIPETHPLLSPSRNSVSYVTTSTRTETLSPVSRPTANTESIMYRTQRDYASSEPSSVIHNKDMANSTPLSEVLMSATNMSALTDISTNISTSLVSPGIKTLVVKPYTVASVPELTAIQMNDTTPRKLNIPDTVTAISDQDENQSKGDPQHAVICVPSKVPSVPDLIYNTKKSMDDTTTGANTISEERIDMRRIYLEGTHQDDYLIKPVRTDFVPHVIPIQSPRHRNGGQVLSMITDEIVSATSPAHSPKPGDKKPRLRLLPDSQPVLEPDSKQEVSIPKVEEHPDSCSTKQSPRRVAGQSLYSADLASSHMESLASSISHSAFEATGINPDLIVRPPVIRKDLMQMNVETLLNKSRSNSSFVAPDLADVEDYTEHSLYFVVTDKRGQDILSPDSLTCEAAGRRLIDSKPRDADETAMTAIMGGQQFLDQIISGDRKLSTDFDEMDPPVIVCDTGETPPIVIRSKTVAPPMSFEENIALLQNAKQDGCISYSRSRAGSRAISLSRRSMSIGRFSEAPSI